MTTTTQAATFTPGPWKTGTPGRGRFCVYGKEHGIGVCVMSNTQKTWRADDVARYGEHELNLIADANARLIAAAPELLEALEALFENCAMIHNQWGEGCNAKEANEAQRKARAAIAKAKGGAA